MQLRREGRGTVADAPIATISRSSRRFSKVVLPGRHTFRSNKLPAVQPVLPCLPALGLASEEMPILSWFLYVSAPSPKECQRKLRPRWPLEFPPLGYAGHVPAIRLERHLTFATARKSWT